ncbi:hypothetical protein ASL20_03810 [Cupriavidus necator]|nr:hypothetical protein ASL20_03810 [Cupriavidus necator]
MISHADLGELVVHASKSGRLRQHRNIHASYEDPCQRLLNAVELDSYIRPHRHSLDPKVETLFALIGRFAVFSFDATGAIRNCVCIGSEKYMSNSVGVAVEVDPRMWHTVIALEGGSILLELKAGPFDPDLAKEFAPWAPEEGGGEANDYLRSLRAYAMASAT